MHSTVLSQVLEPLHLEHNLQQGDSLPTSTMDINERNWQDTRALPFWIGQGHNKIRPLHMRCISMRDTTANEITCNARLTWKGITLGRLLLVCTYLVGSFDVSWAFPCESRLLTSANNTNTVHNKASSINKSAPRDFIIVASLVAVAMRSSSIHRRRLVQ